MGKRWRAQNPTGSWQDFYASIGPDTVQWRRQCHKAIGKRLAAEWVKIQAKASAKVTERAAQTLADRVESIIEGGLQAFGVGMSALKPHRQKSRFTDPKTKKPVEKMVTMPPVLDASNAEEALQLMRIGGKLALDGIGLLTGNDPLKPPEKRTGRIKFNEPIIPPAARAKKATPPERA